MTITAPEAEAPPLAPAPVTITCPLPGCGLVAGSVWQNQDAPDAGRPWLARVPDLDLLALEVGPRSAVTFVLDVHRDDRHPGLDVHSRLALHAHALAIVHTLRGDIPTTPIVTTAECAWCQAVLVGDGHSTWWDDGYSSSCPVNRELCPEMCRPHLDSPSRCGTCRGTGSILHPHEPVITVVA